MILEDKYKLNYRPDPKDERDFVSTRNLALTEGKEIEYSLSVDYTSQMSDIKDQGQLGSCVGFATVAMKEWQEQREQVEELLEGKKYTRKEDQYDLSEQWVYFKAKEIDEWPNEEGTSYRYALKVLQKQGVPPEKGWPYDDIEVGKPERWSTMISLWSKCGAYRRLYDVEDITYSLQTNGPCLIAIGCYEEIFYVGKDGLVPYPKNPNALYGGHALCAVGFDNSKKLIKFKNSWGTSWGENGYGYLPYDYIQDFCWDAWEVIDIRVTRDMLKKK